LGKGKQKYQNKFYKRRVEKKCPGRPSDFVKICISTVVLKLKKI
jgi:hypothetical protein